MSPSLLRRLATLPIVAYQKTFSFDHGPMRRMYPYGFCPFYPSCSEYCRQSILRRGIFLGIFCGVWRVLRCHPLSKGGVDLP